LASQDLLRLIAGLSPTSEEIRILIEVIRRVTAERRSAEAAVREIETKAGRLGAVVRLVPRGQGNILAFLALVVAIATLVENTLGDLGKLLPKRTPVRTPGPSQHASADRRLDVTEVSSKGSPRWQLILAGTVNLSEPFELWAFSYFYRSKAVDYREAAPITVSTGPWTCRLTNTSYGILAIRLTIGFVHSNVANRLRRLKQMDEHTPWVDLADNMSFSIFGPICSQYFGYPEGRVTLISTSALDAKTARTVLAS